MVTFAFVAHALMHAGSLSAAMLSAAVAVPDGTSFTEDGGSDNLFYSLTFGPINDPRAVASAQADYGILKGYVYSNIGTSVPGYGSIAGMAFVDSVIVSSPLAGFLNVDILIEGDIVYMDTPITGLNSQLFTSTWVLESLADGSVDECRHDGAYLNVPSLPISCTISLPVAAGISQFHFAAEMHLDTLGRASATKIDLFNTAEVLGMFVVDANGNRVNALFESDSGTIYPSGSPSEVPEPAAVLLLGGALVAMFRLRRHRTDRGSFRSLD